jgi:hypothetical protein
VIVEAARQKLSKHFCKMSCDRTLLKNINHLCGQGNAPDLADWFAITSKADILAPLPTLSADKHAFSAPFTMRPAVAATSTTAAVPAGKWQRWEVAKTDSSFDMGEKDGYYEPKVEYFIEKTDPFKTKILMDARGADKRIVLIDNNRNLRFMDNAMVVANEVSSPRNGYKVTITCGKINDPLPFVEHDLVF